MKKPNYFEIICILAREEGSPRASFKACLRKLEEMAQAFGPWASCFALLEIPELKKAHSEFRKAPLSKMGPSLRASGGFAELKALFELGAIGAFWLLFMACIAIEERGLSGGLAWLWEIWARAFNFIIS